MAKASSHRSMLVILGRWAGDGSGIVRPSFPTWSFKLEFTRSRKREEKGEKASKVHVLTVHDGPYLAVGKVAGHRRKPVVPVDGSNIVRIAKV